MTEPETCSVCGKPLQRAKHRAGHHGHVNWEARIRTCPHNVGTHRYSLLRHDEWHLTDDGWVKRDSDEGETVS